MVITLKNIDCEQKIMTSAAKDIKDILERLVNIDEDQLDEEMRVFPSVFVYFQELATEVSMELENLREEQKQWFARFTLRRFEELKNMGIKPSFSKVEREIHSLDAYYEYERKIRSKLHCYYRMLHVVKALEAKKDLMIQLSANKRNELKLNL